MTTPADENIISHDDVVATLGRYPSDTGRETLTMANYRWAVEITADYGLSEAVRNDLIIALVALKLSDPIISPLEAEFPKDFILDQTRQINRLIETAVNPRSYAPEIRHPRVRRGVEVF